MPGARSARVIRTVLRCYPARWRSRHGDEAAELAVLLMRDGTRASSIAWSYLKGAVRERLTPPPVRRLGTVRTALLAATALLAIPLALMSASPAHAASAAKTAERVPCSGLPGVAARGGMARTWQPAEFTSGGSHGDHC
jgi:hypothetical protein